ncbi:VipE [Legionella birminghamensis]|uniref:VipE n=1 Tax=Legionella birminghamensis TaxID=28083 RepID=A0A378I689_9GAMM|nr:hypothetical protein [Legionella birminghamensis]KTC73794.1 VipE [Legionella birminghamensis]STX30708.1 VipE [Legionella birminghamensis]
MANGTRSARESKNKQKDLWKPMDHTRGIISRWGSQLLNADLSNQDIKNLESEILQGSRYHPINAASDQKLTYSDAAYTQKEAMIDFILAVCPYLSLQNLHQFTSMALAKETNSLDNTFLRNNELARYLLVYEAGIYAGSAPKLQAMFLSHFKAIAFHFSEEGWLNIINHSILQTLNNLKKDYAGFENLQSPEGIDPEIVQRLKEPQFEASFARDQDQPPLPAWFCPEQNEKKCRHKLHFFGFRQKERPFEQMDINPSQNM